jgi:hypothetical protein
MWMSVDVCWLGTLAHGPKRDRLALTYIRSLIACCGKLTLDLIKHCSFVALPSKELMHTNLNIIITCLVYFHCLTDNRRIQSPAWCFNATIRVSPG